MFTIGGNRFTIPRITQRYNPEHDIPPGPEVSWVEYELLQLILELEERLSVLEAAAAQDQPPIGR